MASLAKRTRAVRKKDGRTGQMRTVTVEFWRARYRDAAGKEHERHFPRKVDAQKWLDEVTASQVSGSYVDPKTARITVGEWCQTWLAGYATRRPSTVRQARVHVAQIIAEFGPVRLSAVRPSHVKSWTARLRAEPLEASYVYALHSRLAQIMADAVHDGIISRSPCSRRTSPGQGKQRPYVATTEQVWALYDAMPEYLRAAILLGAFAGLRSAEACGLRTADVDFMRGIVCPRVQYPAEELKTEIFPHGHPRPAFAHSAAGRSRAKPSGRDASHPGRGRRAGRAVAARARHALRPGQGGRPAGRLPLSRFAALGGRLGYAPCRGVSAARSGGARVVVRIISLLAGVIAPGSRASRPGTSPRSSPARRLG